MILYTQLIVSCGKVVWPFKIVFHFNLPMLWTFVVEDVTGVTNIDYDEHKKNLDSDGVKTIWTKQGLHKSFSFYSLPSGFLVKHEEIPFITFIIPKYLARMLSEMRTLFYLRFFNLSSYLKSHFLVGVSCG